MENPWGLGWDWRELLPRARWVVEEAELCFVDEDEGRDEEQGLLAGSAVTVGIFAVADGSLDFGSEGFAVAGAGGGLAPLIFVTGTVSRSCVGESVVTSLLPVCAMGGGGDNWATTLAAIALACTASSISRWSDLDIDSRSAGCTSERTSGVGGVRPLLVWL